MIAPIANRSRGTAISWCHPFRSRERGGTKLNLALALLVLGVLIFIAAKIVPVYFAQFQLEDAIRTEARFAIANRKTDEDIRSDVLRKAQELDIPAHKDKIRVTSANGYVQIFVDYSVPVDLKFYQLTLQFNLHADNRTI